jgi:hypothetical protein
VPGAAPGDAGAVARCPRCGGGFHCGARDPRPCACTAVDLPAATLQALRTRWEGCLCVACLRAVAGGAAIAP